MINQIYNNTSVAIPKCIHSVVSKSLNGRIVCIADFVFACAVSCKKAAKNWYQHYQLKQLKSALAKWADKEGGRANEAVAKILDCYSQKNTNLILRNLGLNSLPECLLELTNLKRLDVSWNKLKSLTDELCELKSLTSLNVSRNGLRIFTRLGG